MTDPVAPAAPAAEPSTETLIAAFAQAFLPFAGPAGVAAASMIPAVQNVLHTLMQDQTKNYTLAELEAIVASGNAHLAALQQHHAAQP